MAAHLWKRIMQPFVAHCSLLIARCSLQSGAQERTERETQTDQAVIQFVSRVFLKEKQNKQTNAKRIIKEKRKKKRQSHKSKRRNQRGIGCAQQQRRMDLSLDEAKTLSQSPLRERANKIFKKRNKK